MNSLFTAQSQPQRVGRPSQYLPDLCCTFWTSIWSDYALSDSRKGMSPSKIANSGLLGRGEGLEGGSTGLNLGLLRGGEGGAFWTPLPPDYLYLSLPPRRRNPAFLRGGTPLSSRLRRAFCQGFPPLPYHPPFLGCCCFYRQPRGWLASVALIALPRPGRPPHLVRPDGGGDQEDCARDHLHMPGA